MTSTRLPSVLTASATLSAAQRQNATDDVLAWRSVATLVHSLHEHSKGVTWPPPAVPYGTWPLDHVAAAKLRVLLTAHGSRTHPVGAQELLQMSHELELWLSRARLYPVLSTILARFDQRMKRRESTMFESLDKAEVLALAQSVIVKGRALGQARVHVPRRPRALVGSVGGTLKRVKVAPAQATPAETEAVGAMFDGMVQGDGSLGAEWTKRVRFVAYLIDSDAVQRSIGEGQGVRAISDQILAGLAGVSASTVRRRSVDVSKLLPSTFRWG